MDETKTCSQCGRELPIDRFKIGKGGERVSVCCDCIRAKRRTNSPPPPTATYNDPQFDGQSIGDVFRLMGRAKRWLESRGCVIRLEGEYTETKTHKLKY